MADLSTLPDLLPWPYMVCNRAGLVLYANPSADRALGRRVRAGMDVNLLFLELDNGRPISSLLYNAARWSAWSGLLEIRNNEKEIPIRAVKVIMQPDPKHHDQVWLLFADDALVNGLPLLTPRSGMGLARTLIENSPDFIIFRDLQGRILHTSRSLDEFLGLPHRGFVDDLGLRDILAPATAEQFLQFDEEVIRTGQRVRHSILRFETLDGRSRLVRVAHERVKGGAGLPAGLLTFAVNITESVDEHNRLRVALEKAEEVAAAKWQFMANVTHEIRNPINAIQGLCETALEAPEEDPAEVLAKIRRCATELEDMVRDVLDFSRLDRGNITVEINGREVSGAKDVTPRKGYICLESEGSPIWFKDLCVKELPAAVPALDPKDVAMDGTGMVRLFDGQTLAGWHEEKGKEGHWKFEGGAAKFDGKGDSLWTDASYSDFEMVVDWRWTKEHQGKMLRPYIDADGNEAKNADGSVKQVEIEERDSGIYVRGNSKSQINIWSWPVGSGEVWGYRTDRNMTPAVRAACTPKVNADKPVEQWNRFVIRMVSDRLTVDLNGKRVIDNAQLPGVPASGQIALQSHGCPVEFQNVFIRQLK